MIKGLVGGWEVSSRAELSWSWVFSNMTLPSFGHQARVVVLSYTTKRKGVSSEAKVLIFARYLWMKLSLSGHQAMPMAFNLFLRTWKKYNKKEWKEDGRGKSESQMKVPQTLYKGTHKWDTMDPCISWTPCPLSTSPIHLISFTWLI